FNSAFRGQEATRVVAFTATQIPYIDDRTYPAVLAGPGYPDGIPIFLEEELPRLIADLKVDQVVFAYSDVSHEYVMHRGSQVLAAGASFVLLGPDATMLDARVPVVAVCAVRTGSGKSQTTRRVVEVLRGHGRRVVVVRHPMPYGDLVAQRVQRFETFEDLDTAGVTIEEREEYEPHLRRDTVVYAGVDYGAILGQAQAECDVLIWDGGNNDLPFYAPTVHLTVADPLRAGHERSYHPGETNLRMADAVVINKIDSATPDQVQEVERSIVEFNPSATVIKARSPVVLEDGADLAGKRVLVIEDGPTLTHGEMQFGAGVVAARKQGAAEIVDPRQWAEGSMRDVYAKYEVGPVLPAMGYSEEQLREFEHMINAAGTDAVLIATPIDLRKLVRIEAPAYRVSYELEEVEGSPTVEDVLAPVLGASG
ncbi:MAG TPA: GTPase, partial [Actinomycetota bacterium]|nr:GTPase [Actinomycetota bacterium]